MIFTDLRFIVLFVLCWGSFFLVPRRWRAAVLAFFGTVFYAIYAGRALLIVIVLVALVFVSGVRAFLAWLAGVAIVGVLAYYKLAYVVPALPGAAGDSTSLIVPLGLSYLSFELLHVTIERHRGRIRDLAWTDLLAFAFFAPARAAGPIKRFPHFIDEVRNAELSAANVYSGFLRVLLGLTKKFLLADILALTVRESNYAASMHHAWIIVLAYSLQIYFDFSAYSDIAIGLSRMMGIRLPENFRNPYLSPNIRDFWNRWHITLSQWVRDYVFTPTGRTLMRTRLRPWPFVIAAISYLIAFAVVGAWHGLTAGFLIWGLYHGLLLTLYHGLRLKIPPVITDHPWYGSRVARALAIAVTFFLVTVGWVPFMLPLPDAKKMLVLMFGLG